MSLLKDYLDTYGILACNTTKYLPGLEDIGCDWGDAMDLINSHELFYSKAYRKRTTYLSIEAYFLLKNIRSPKPIDETSRNIIGLLEDNGTLDMKTLKTLCGSEMFSKAFAFLLKNMYITALKEWKPLNPNWSEFCYCTAETWERCVKKPEMPEDCDERLREILLKSMTEKEYIKFIRG